MSRSRRAAPVTSAPAGIDRTTIAILAVTLGLFVAIAYGRNLALTFVGDDYVFLERVLREPITAVASPANTDFGWYRPWSRDLHFWVLAHVVGLSPLAFRLVGIGLWVTAFVLYFSIVASVTPWPAAVLATMGTSSLALWGTPLLWISGSQDLWMLVFAMGALWLHARHRRVLPAVAVGLALLSKETAAVVPLLLVAWSLLVDRDPPRIALRRALPTLAVLATWMVLHPTLRTRIVHRDLAIVEVATRPSVLGTLLRALGSAVNLDRVPRPLDAFPTWIVPVLLSTAVLVLSAVWMLRRQPGRGVHPRANVLAFGAVWAVLGSLPLLIPSIGWQPYYGCLGALGLWVVLGTLLAPRPALAVAFIGGLALLRGAQAETPSWKWGDVWYQRRAAQVVSAIHTQLTTDHPTLPPYTRIFFGRIPNNVGLVAGKSPAVRVWYRDSTLSSDFFSAYRPRAVGEPAGPDLFFRFDSLRAIVPVGDTGLPVAEAMRRNPEWLSDQLKLAYLFLEKGDRPAAARQFELVARAPGQEDAILFAGVCWREAGVTGRADSLFRAARRTLGRDSIEIAGVVRDLTASMPRFPSSDDAPPADAGRSR